MCWLLPIVNALLPCEAPFVTVKCVLRLLQGVSVLVYAMCWLLSGISVSVNAEWKCLVTTKNKCGNCMPFVSVLATTRWDLVSTKCK